MVLYAVLRTGPIVKMRSYTVAVEFSRHAVAYVRAANVHTCDVSELPIQTRSYDILLFSAYAFQLCRESLREDIILSVS